MPENIRRRDTHKIFDIYIFKIFSKHRVLPGKEIYFVGRYFFHFKNFFPAYTRYVTSWRGGGGEYKGRGAKEVGKEETRFLVPRKDRKRHFLTDTYSSPDVVSFEVHPPMFAATKTRTTTRRDDAPESERERKTEKKTERQRER